jgi:hypothetical protein
LFFVDSPAAIPSHRDSCIATDAYLLSFPCCKSRAAAAASASRLKKRPMIQATRRWFMACGLGTYEEEMPNTPAGIYSWLAELRAKKGGE